MFVRGDTRGVSVLPWPSAAAAVGLGLLHALDWTGTARKRLKAGDRLHPTQHPLVTAALLSGHHTPLWNGDRELKAQIWPDQFPDWFGIALATSGHAAALLFPHVTPDAPPTATPGGQLADHDFMTGPTEDRYPDVFGLAGGVDGGGTTDARHHVTARLTDLPHHTITVGHDTAANADFLNTLLL
ncbi:hypothetical protein AQ490_26535 [Wenjunlia vitaminophila]|uniref:Uncharacterized protein n=1 Tax=Wenjunlia vitaminophila TaxID=76728 RepID=A0A0T6LQE8_WENVI|nr:hypothetical protein AQ490_26535 [Wenjunlia vitaminophila]